MRTITRLSLQALLGRRRGLVLLVMPVVLVGLAILIRWLTYAGVGYEMVNVLGYGLVLPLVALLSASAVLGPEIDDGSVVYLLAKPVNRHLIALGKYLVAALATLVFGALPILVTGLILDNTEPGQALAWLAGSAVVGTAYTALFLALAALTRHAVVAGLLFVLLWEGLLGGLLSGIKWLSIGDWGRQIGHALSPAIDSPDLPTAYAVGASVVLTLAGVWFAGDRLRSFALTGDE